MSKNKGIHRMEESNMLSAHQHPVRRIENARCIRWAAIIDAAKHVRGKVLSAQEPACR